MSDAASSTPDEIELVYSYLLVRHHQARRAADQERSEALYAAICTYEAEWPEETRRWQTRMGIDPTESATKAA